MAQNQTIEPTVAVPASAEPRMRITIPASLVRFLRNWKAATGVSILLFFVVVSLLAPTISPVDPNRRVARPNQPPGSELLFGSSRQGQDIFAQVIHGGRSSLSVGFFTGTVIIIIGIVVGLTAGYVGGWVDEFLSLLTNVVLIIPGLPLIIVVAGWIDNPGPFTIVVVLSLTSWAYGARVLRSQTLVLRNSEFVAAARVSGESTWRIIAFEILPNMTSLVVSGWIGAVLFVILTQAGLEFIGLGNPNAVTWGTTLYWAQSNQALLTKAWWTFIPPGVCIALVGLSLVMINYGIDEITNPRLQNDKLKESKS